MTELYTIRSYLRKCPLSVLPMAVIGKSLAHGFRNTTNCHTFAAETNKAR